MIDPAVHVKACEDRDAMIPEIAGLRAENERLKQDILALEARLMAARLANPGELQSALFVAHTRMLMVERAYRETFTQSGAHIGPDGYPISLALLNDAIRAIRIEMGMLKLKPLPAYMDRARLVIALQRIVDAKAAIGSPDGCIESKRADLYAAIDEAFALLTAKES